MLHYLASPSSQLRSATATHGRAGTRPYSPIQTLFPPSLACRETRQWRLQVWNGTHTGLVVHERLINCPQELAAPLLQALFDEIAWATEDEPNEQVTALPRSGINSA